jgi:signal transduction histidine kinase
MRRDRAGELTGIRIQGRWLFNLPGFLIAFPLAVCIFADEIVTAPNSRQAWQWILIITLSYVCVWIYGTLISTAAIRMIDATTMNLPRVILVAGSFGLALCLVIWVLASLLQISDGTDWLVKLLILVPGAAWWGCLTAYAMEFRDSSAKTRATLIEQRIALATSELEQNQILLDIQDELDREVDDELDTCRKRVAELLQQDQVLPEEWKQLSRTLIDAADQSVKPLSRRMWKKSVENYPRATPLSLFINTICYQPFRPIALTVIAFGSSVAISVQELGAGVGISLLCLVLLGFLILAYSANALMRRFPGAHVPIFVVTFILIQVETWAVQQIRDEVLEQSTPPALFAFRVLASAILVLATSGMGSWFDSRRSLERTFQNSLKEEKIASVARSREVARLAQESARILHGSVQTRLVSCSLVIERALESGDGESLERALIEARSILEDPSLCEVPNPGVREEIVRKLELWKGICTFQVAVEEVISLPSGMTSQSVGRVVEEAVTNAVRHGQASWISIDLRTLGDSQLHLTVWDNGRGPGNGKPGIGSALLDQITLGHWSLTGDKTGSTLEAVLS